jgi:hypothetical protein
MEMMRRPLCAKSVIENPTMVIRVLLKFTNIAFSKKSSHRVQVEISVDAAQFHILTPRADRESYFPWVKRISIEILKKAGCNVAS